MKKTITSIAEMYIDEDGILRSKIIPGVTITKDNLLEYYNATNLLLEGKKALVLFDASAEYNTTEEAKTFGASKEFSSNRIAIAYLTNSLSNRLMFNLYLIAYKPLVPTKMFSSEANALVWLKTFYVLPGDKFVKVKRK